MTAPSTLHMNIEDSLRAAIAKSDQVSAAASPTTEPGLAGLAQVFAISFCSGALGAGLAHLAFFLS